MMKRFFAGLTALLLCASCSGYTAHAQGTKDGISLAIDRITLTMDELAALDHTVPVHVRVTENSGFDAAEFGIHVDERCRFDKDIKWLDFDDGYASSNGAMLWRALANHEDWNQTGTILRLNLEIPQDAQVGDVFPVTYCDKLYRSHLWSSISSDKNYTDAGQLSWTNGYVEIIETPEKSSFSLGKDDWSFCNSVENFKATGYTINNSFYQRLSASLSGPERTRVLSALSKPWGGACYGMAVTSMLAYDGQMIPAQWQVGAHSLHDLNAPPSDEIQSLIHYYYALQKTDIIQQTMTEFAYLKTEAEKLEILDDCLSDGSPTLLTYLDYEWGAHAVVAYDVVSGHFVHSGNSYDRKVLVYDSNHPELLDEYCLYFSTATGEWALPGYGLHSSGSFLGMVTDDLMLLNYAGYLDGTDYIPPTPYISLLTSAPLDGSYTISITDQNGNVLSQPQIHTKPADGGIKAYASLTGAQGVQEISFALPEAQRSYALELAQPQALELTMNYEDCLLMLTADSANGAAFSPDGAVQLHGAQDGYSLLFSSDTLCDAQEWYLHIEGQDAATAELTCTDGGFLLTADNLTRISVDAEHSGILGFSTDAQTVFLSCAENGALTAAVDTDGDGSYETCLADSTHLLTGDVTLDGTLTMTDVILLSQNLYCGEKLNTAQTAFSDMDGDGTITAADQLRMLHSLLGVQ